MLGQNTSLFLGMTLIVGVISFFIHAQSFGPESYMLNNQQIRSIHVGMTRDNFIAAVKGKNALSGMNPKRDAEFTYKTESGGYCTYSFRTRYGSKVWDQVIEAKCR